ncbi:MAG: NADPH-dependent oxidoreductase [Hymenobacter sp.]|nr:MAG: NADPH-dependent oxidoreductase [Hymenobacter sp.]
MAPLPLVLLASARPAGDTAALVRALLSAEAHTLVNLLDAPLYPYSYAGTYPADDAFPALLQQVLQHDTIVLATPVYWYAMSGLLKTFFDRLTDLVTSTKPLGRQLRGKRLLVLATGSDAALPAGFEVPFQHTARYFAMVFGGCWYYSQKKPPSSAALAQWQQQLRQALAENVPPTAAA